MTASQRIAIGLLLVALIALSGLWLLLRRLPPAPPPPAATPTPTVVAVPTTTPTPLRAAPGFRLAGVATGDEGSYAAIESPDGSAALYALHTDVPGLGTVVRIDEDRVVIRSAAGEFALVVVPAPAPTPTIAQPTPRPTRTWRRLTPRGAGAAPTRESWPSDVPGRPAS